MFSAEISPVLENAEPFHAATLFWTRQPPSPRCYNVITGNGEGHRRFALLALVRY
jgi:hypothetical protein